VGFSVQLDSLGPHFDLCGLHSFYFVPRKFACTVLVGRLVFCWTPFPLFSTGYFFTFDLHDVVETFSFFEKITYCFWVFDNSSFSCSGGFFVLLLLLKTRLLRSFYGISAWVRVSPFPFIISVQVMVLFSLPCVSKNPLPKKKLKCPSLSSC